MAGKAPWHGIAAIDHAAAQQSNKENNDGPLVVGIVAFECVEDIHFQLCSISVPSHIPHHFHGHRPFISKNYKFAFVNRCVGRKKA